MAGVGEVDILLVEDSLVDAELVAEALKDANIPHRLDIASNGEEALKKLRARDINPDLILLDLNLPKVTGIEVLKTIKQDPRLRVIPVIILTNSTAPDDVTKCYWHHANAYVRKPIGFDGLTETISIAGQFWFKAVLLPTDLDLSSIPLPPPVVPPKQLHTPPPIVPAKYATLAPRKTTTPPKKKGAGPSPAPASKRPKK